MAVDKEVEPVRSPRPTFDDGEPLALPGRRKVAYVTRLCWVLVVALVFAFLVAR